eukprot:319766-Rhodomonas_salina.7
MQERKEKEQKGRENEKRKTCKAESVSASTPLAFDTASGSAQPRFCCDASFWNCSRTETTVGYARSARIGLEMRSNSECAEKLALYAMAATASVMRFSFCCEHGMTRQSPTLSCVAGGYGERHPNLSHDVSVQGIA